MYQYSKKDLPTGLSSLFVILIQSTIGKRDLNFLKAFVFLNFQRVLLNTANDDEGPQIDELNTAKYDKGP